MIALSVNLNKIALIRNSREGNFPDVLEHARLCVTAGADGITIHPRPDQRHIRATDAFEIANVLAELRRINPKLEFNIEGNPFAGPMASNQPHVGDYPGFMELVRQIKPDQCTLVPDSNDQLTSDHGFDLHRQGNRLLPLIDELKKLGCRVSLFMDPVDEQIRLAKQLGADRIELYTGPYADAVKHNDRVDEIYQSFHVAAQLAQDIGLGLNAGHDLNLINLPRFAGIPGLLEVSIGHALIVDALHYGLVETIKRYKSCLR